MIFDLVEAGEIDVFTFQKEFFLAYLRAASFRDVKVEYNPTFGKIGLRIILGAYRKYGVELLETNAEPPRLWDRKDLPFQGHWEGQAAYATPWGTLRAGMGGLEGSAPFYFLRMGAGFKLGFEEKP